MAKKHQQVQVAERLMARLTPEQNRQPLLECESWLIHWRPDSSRADRLCVGVALRVGDDIVTRLVTDTDLDQLSSLLRPVQRAQIRTLLDAIDVRLRQGNAIPPAGIHYDAPKFARGDSVPEIIDMLWEFGPGLLTLRAPTASEPEATTKTDPSKKKHKA